MNDIKRISRFCSADLKFYSAINHYNNFKNNLDSFMGSGQIGVQTFYDREAEEGKFLASIAVNFPDQLKLAAGDVIHNLRASLDHLAVGLARENGHETRTAIKEVYFPVAMDEQSFLKSDRLKRLSSQAQSLLSNLKPYRGGNDALWQLHHLDILDKHVNVLPAAALTHIESVEVGLLVDAATGQQETVAVQIFKPNGDFIFPIKDKDVLLCFKCLQGFPRMEIKIKYSWAFSDTGIADGEEILDLLHSFIHAVGNVLEQFQ